jgi:cbb3-type cytochrome oxidase subunit 1
MSPLTIRCIRAALLYLALGIALGAAFALDRSYGAWLRPLHAELNLWGWVTLLIYGLAYHMLPRFAGRQLPRPALASAQAWAAIGGVALAALGWLLLVVAPVIGRPLLAAGAALQLLAALGFALLAGRLLRQ